MGKKKKADLMIALDILDVLISADLPRDHPDRPSQKKIEQPALRRAYKIVNKVAIKEYNKRWAEAQKVPDIREKGQSNG